MRVTVRVLRKECEPRDKVKGDWRKVLTRHFIIRTIYQILLG